MSYSAPPLEDASRTSSDDSRSHVSGGYSNLDGALARKEASSGVARHPRLPPEGSEAPGTSHGRATVAEIWLASRQASARALRPAVGHAHKQTARVMQTVQCTHSTHESSMRRPMDHSARVIEARGRTELMQATST